MFVVCPFLLLGAYFCVIYSGWEIPIDDVLLDGEKLPQPFLPNGVAYTGLVDSVSTGTYMGQHFIHIQS